MDRTRGQRYSAPSLRYSPRPPEPSPRGPQQPRNRFPWAGRMTRGGFRSSGDPEQAAECRVPKHGGCCPSRRRNSSHAQERRALGRTRIAGDEARDAPRRRERDAPGGVTRARRSQDPAPGAAPTVSSSRCTSSSQGRRRPRVSDPPRTGSCAAPSSRSRSNASPAAGRKTQPRRPGRPAPEPVRELGWDTEWYEARGSKEGGDAGTCEGTGRERRPLSF